MNFDFLNEMSKKIFGIDILYTYLERKLKEKKTIVISEFASDGFFWAQYLDELVILIIKVLLHYSVSSDAH